MPSLENWGGTPTEKEAVVALSMKSTKVQKPWHNKCSAVVEKNYYLQSTTYTAYRTVSGHVYTIIMLIIIRCAPLIIFIFHYITTIIYRKSKKQNIRKKRRKKRKKTKQKNKQKTKANTHNDSKCISKCSHQIKLNGTEGGEPTWLHFFSTNRWTNAETNVKLLL